MKEESNATYCIYILTNKINGKKYVGQSKDYKKRMNQYKRNDCKGQHKVYNAIKKYGWENFESCIIINKLCQIDANDLEIYMIAYYNSTKFGYNISKGGGGVKIQHSEETKIKIGNKSRGRKQPRKFLEEFELRIVENYLDKVPSKEIKKLYNITTQDLCKILKRYKVETMGNQRFDLETKTEILEKHKTGVSANKLANEYNTNHRTILNLLQKYNQDTSFKKLFSTKQVKDIINLYNLKVNQKEISFKFNCSITTIQRIIRRHKTLSL